MDRGGETTHRPPSRGVVVVGSGKGGVGTSTVSALLAMAGARDGRRVLLVDSDEGVGSLHLLLGIADPSPGLGDLKGGEVTPQELLRPVSSGLFFLPGGGSGKDATLATGLGERRALYQRVSSLYPEFDMVVVDGGSHLASVAAACAAGAERLIALTTSDRVAMAATYALLKVSRERFPTLPVEILVNRQSDPQADEIFRVMATAGTRFLGLDPSFAGAIPHDPQIQTGSEEGIPLLDLDFPAPSLEAAGLIHGRLAAEQESVETGSATILSGSF